MIDKFLNINSIDPNYWGKSGWIFLNSMALTYKPEHKESYKEFILKLPIVLPCNSCGENLKKKINSIDEALLSKENLINWFIEIRNEIYKNNNECWKQKNFKDTIDEIFYLHSSSFNIYLYIFFLLLLLILLLYFFIIQKKK